MRHTVTPARNAERPPGLGRRLGRGLRRAVLNRTVVTFAAVTAMFAAVAARLAELHVRKGAPRAAESREISPPLRGRIVDRRGVTLAADRPYFRLVVDPRALCQEGLDYGYAVCLARVLNRNAAELHERIRTHAEKRYLCLAADVSPEESARIRAMKLRHNFAWLEPAPRRDYPHGELAAHVVGYLYDDRKAGGGVESATDVWLRGRPGLRLSIRDRRQRELRDRRSVDLAPEDGATVQLTIDLNLQSMLEAGLDSAVQQHRPLAAWGIILNVRTGEILAMASRPTFNPNAPGDAPRDALENRAVAHVFEPGSVFKVATISTALDAGVVRPDTIFDCEHGRWFYQGRWLRDFHPYGLLTTVGVTQKSSNIGAAKIALLIGERRFDEHLRAFGLDRRPGTGLPEETAGLLPPRGRWGGLTLTRVAIGHGVSVTGLHLVAMLAAVGNGGQLMRPWLIRRVVDARGRVIESFAPQPAGRPLSESAARAMCEILATVTEPEGTGRRAALPGLRVAGKTGTATKIGPHGHDENRNIASFVGMVPAENPVIAVLISIDEPQPEHTGGLVAAPVFRQVAEEAVRYLGIAPGGRGVDTLALTAADIGEDKRHVDRTPL